MLWGFGTKNGESVPYTFGVKYKIWIRSVCCFKLKIILLYLLISKWRLEMKIHRGFGTRTEGNLSYEFVFGVKQNI